MFSGTARFRRVLFLLLLPLALLLAACSQAAPPAPTHVLSSNPVVRWIQQNAIPLRTTDPGGSNADLAPLKQIVGNASIVGLGEETHGTHEFIDIKARLTEYLISTLGFTTFVMENDWGRSQILNAYINGGPGNITSVMSQSLDPPWQTQEYQALFEWMRAYNANPAHTTKIHFLGMDLQTINQSDFDTVENYLQKVDVQRVARVRDLYAPILSNGLLAPSNTFPQLDASARYQNRAQQVYNLLQANQQNYINHSSPQSFALALQNARIIVQFTTFYNYSTESDPLALYYQRDTFMAENVEWIYDHEAGVQPKIIVWAHDAHIANDTTYTTQDGRNMGGELRTRYGKSYLPIGTTLYQGTFRIYYNSSSAIQTIQPPGLYPSTYNYTLGQAGIPLYMLDLRKIPPGLVNTWALSSIILINYGLGGEDLSTPALLSQWFDVIIHVQNTTPARHF
ncbi:MAG: erythromycin esterase family protein [Ktedonobacteraceae bacterium]